MIPRASHVGEQTGELGHEHGAVRRQLVESTVQFVDPRHEFGEYPSAVDTEMRARLAISRSDASGSSMISRWAVLRPSVAQSGRTRPSRLIRSFDCSFSTVERFRIRPTVPAASPAVRAITRSDHIG